MSIGNLTFSLQNLDFNLTKVLARKLLYTIAISHFPRYNKFLREKEITTFNNEHLSLSIPYDLSRNPAKVNPYDIKTLEDLKEGANCQLLTAVLLIWSGTEIPPGTRSSEIALAQNYGIALDDIKAPKVGSIIGLMPKDQTDPKKIHLTYVQKITESGIRVIHASRADGKARIDDISQLETNGYDIAFIKHPTRRDINLIRPDMLKLFGIAIDK